MSRVYTGIRALQLISGATKIVIKRSFQLEIVRLAMTPGIAQAALDNKGTTLLPFRPKGRIMRSMINTTRDIYPVSSKIPMKKNNKTICGTKMITPPIPGMIPFASSSVNIPAGNAPCR